ncbi:uncharacterized protein LOC135694720 [Rhopilema esculentum]|uniref:uncharacterized protein LOC135694720 n=1 Tax=Rhopilema esculentum TaxID=499914 RepID=UPI0031D73A5B|eukprot:gene4791-21100_t
MDRSPSHNKARDEKVRLMQERQKYWMQQRETASKKKDVQADSQLASGKSASRSVNNKQSQSKRGKSDEVLLWTAKKPDAVHDGFVVRKQSAKSDKIASARSTSSKSGSVSNRPNSRTSSLDILSKSDVKKYSKHEAKVDQFTSTPDRKSAANDELDMIIASDISSIKIGSLENQPISNLAKRNEYDKLNYTSLNNRKVDMDEQISKSSSTFTYQSQDNFSDPRINEQGQNNKYSMHCCPMCKKLMHQQSNLPFLIIPCGHNICAQCQPGQVYCPTCNAKIASVVENSTLSQVIKEYKKHEEREELARKEKEARKYVDEYDSLKTRCEVLSNKAEGVIETMEHITSELVGRKTKMKNMEERRQDLLEQIESLKEELSNCEIECKDNERECMELEVSYSKEKENLDLIENTLERVKQSKNRVKTLVHSLIPTFVFDDD